MYVYCKECYVSLIFSECNCHGHADSCVYNSTVDRLGLSLNMNGEYKGGGVCIDCKVSIYIIALLVEGGNITNCFLKKIPLSCCYSGYFLAN